MPNQYQPQFATGAGANTLTNAQWQEYTTLIQTGFQTGVASSAQMNTILRICAMSSAALGYLISQIGLDANDNGVVSEFANKLLTVFRAPIGTVIDYAGRTAPDSHLLCDGAALNITTYSKLFAVIGYTYGGSGGTFNLPYLADRVSVGISNTKLIGTTGGSADAVVVSHQHSISDPSHDHVLYQTNHSHGYSPPAIGFESGGGVAGYAYGTNGYAVQPRPANTTDGVLANASVNGSGTNIGINFTGQSGVGANLPPYIALFKCIRFQ